MQVLFVFLAVERGGGVYNHECVKDDAFMLVVIFFLYYLFVFLYYYYYYFKMRSEGIKTPPLPPSFFLSFFLSAGIHPGLYRGDIYMAVVVVVSTTFCPM